MEQEDSNRSKDESNGFGDFEADLSVVIEPME